MTEKVTLLPGETTWLCGCVRRPPIGSDPALLLQPHQRGVYRAFVQLQYLLAQLLNTARNTESMQQPKSMKDLQNHQIKGALQHLRLVGVPSSLALDAPGRGQTTLTYVRLTLRKPAAQSAATGPRRLGPNLDETQRGQAVRIT